MCLKMQPFKKSLNFLFLFYFYSAVLTMQFLCTSISFSWWLFCSYGLEINSRNSFSMQQSLTVIIKLISKPIISSVTHSSMFHPPLFFFCASVQTYASRCKPATGFCLFFVFYSLRCFQRKNYLKQREKMPFSIFRSETIKSKHFFFSSTPQISWQHVSSVNVQSMTLLHNTVEEMQSCIWLKVVCVSVNHQKSHRHRTREPTSVKMK